MLPVPKAVGKELNTAVVDFVWDGKARLVENCTIVNRVATGGLNLPHMESNINAFRLKMLRRFSNASHKAMWKDCLQYFLEMEYR